MLRTITIAVWLCALLSSAANGGALDNLKSAPASKYELGKVQLEIMAFILTDKLKGEWMEGSSFDINRFSARETSERLVFFASFVGKAKDLTDEQCNTFLEMHASKFSSDGLVRQLWPGLTEEQYGQIKEEFGFGVELVSKENESFKLTCESKL